MSGPRPQTIFSHWGRKRGGQGAVRFSHARNGACRPDVGVALRGFKGPGKPQSDKFQIASLYLYIKYLYIK